MFNHPLALELAHIAVEEAARLGASFADARYEFRQEEAIGTRNGLLHRATILQERGLGVRALVRGAWGFVAVGEPTRHDVAVAARRAVDLARAASILQDQPVRLVDEEPHRAIFRTQIKRDPLAVPIEDKLALLFEVDRRLRTNNLITLARCHFSARRQRKVYVSSEGSEIDQELVWTGIGYQVGASDGSDFQLRSYPIGGIGQFLGRGWEMVGELPLVESTAYIVEEVIAQLRADACPSDRTNVILGGAQLARHIRETVGREVELDRALGQDRASGGLSYLTMDRLGAHEFGSAHVNLYADAREPGAPGTYGFDDEGVEAQRVDLVTQGRFTGYLSSRETAARVGLKRSAGTMRASGWSGCPSVRMTNVSLEPGRAGDLDALIADTKSGILIDAPRNWSSDELGREFQATSEVAWEIKDGKRTRRLKNPVYVAETPNFWRSCDAICGASSWTLFGLAPHPKGRPQQFLSSGHGAAPARFTNVLVGSGDLNPKTFRDGDPIPRLDHPELDGSVHRRTSSVSVATPADLIAAEEITVRPGMDTLTPPPTSTAKKVKPAKKKKGARVRKRKSR